MLDDAVLSGALGRRDGVAYRSSAPEAWCFADGTSLRQTASDPKPYIRPDPVSPVQVCTAFEPRDCTCQDRMFAVRAYSRRRYKPTREVGNRRHYRARR